MFKIVLLIVGDSFFVVLDDFWDSLKIGFHLLVVASALARPTRLDEVGHDLKDSPQSPVLLNFEFVVVELYEHQVFDILLLIPMPCL